MTTPAIRRLEEYHAHLAWSSSRKKAAATSTLRSYWAKNEDPNRKPFVPTESMEHGSLVDAYITDDEAFNERYFAIPEGSPKRPTLTQLNAAKPSESTQALISHWQRIEREANGRKIISAADVARAHAIMQVLAADESIGPIITSDWLAAQEPHFWLADGGYEARYLPDIETADSDLWDLKLTRSANPRLFKAQSYSLGYDIQLDHYRQGYRDKHGRDPRRVGIIAYEWEWPHNCCLFIADDELLQHGHQRGEDAVQAVLRARESGQWPSYGEAALTLPGYIKSGDASAEPAPMPMDEIQLF